MNRFRPFVLLLSLTLMSQAIAQNPAGGLDSDLAWDLDGSPAWKTAPSSSALHGGDVARVLQAGESSMEANVAGPAVISFSWRLSGSDGKGWVSLEIDGREMAMLRRTTAWQSVAINLPSGNHRLRIAAGGMARIPGAEAMVDQFEVKSGDHFPWLTAIGDEPDSLWVVTGSGRVTAEAMPGLWFDDGHVAALRGTDRGGRTSLVRLVEGPARLEAWTNAKGGSFVARNLDSIGSIRRVTASTGNTWDDSPLILGPGLHRVEWVHFYWSAMENEADPYPLSPPANLQTTPSDVSTLASLSITPLTLDSALAGDLTWASSGSNRFVPTLADAEASSLNREQLAALAIERPGPGQDARLSTVINGPAEVSMRAVSEGPDGDVFRILAGGEVKYESGSGGSTGSQIFEIPAGQVSLELEWISGLDEASWPPRKAALTRVEIRRPLPESAATALDAPAGITFFTSHPEAWDIADATPRSGLSASNRPRVIHSSVAFPELSAWVDGPAVLSYWRRADLPAGSSLRFPGILSAYDPGPFSWQVVSVPVPSGRHRLVWYSPSPAQGFFSEASRYFLDAFHLQPGTGVNALSLEEALDTPGRSWASSGDQVTPGDYGQLAFDGMDAVSLAPADQTTSAWVETTVHGPALGSVYSARSHLGITLNGEHPALGTIETTVPDTLWTRTEFSIPPGQHVLRLAGSDPNHPLMLDQVEITGQAVISMADAIDAPSQSFHAGGGLWEPLHSPLASDGDAVFAGGQGSAWIETEISGPALVQFDWQAGPDYTRLTLELDGEEIAVAPVYEPWRTVGIELPAGSHTFRWIFTSPENRRGAPAGLNQFRITPLAGLTLGEALDAPAQIWFTSGPPPHWIGQTDHSHDGEDATCVPSSDDDSTHGGSDLQTSVTGPALVRFWWQKDGDGLAYFQMDGRNLASLTEENSWQEVTVAVPPGSHHFRWTRFKNHYFERRAALYVDDFRIESLPVGLTLGDALNAPDLPWRTSADASWELAWRSLPGGGQEPAAISPATPGGTSWIETDIIGPAVISFLYLEDSFGLSQGSLHLDGLQVATLRGASWPDDAVSLRWPIPAGKHTVRWQWQVASSSAFGNSALERLMIDRVEVATNTPELESLFPQALGVGLIGSHPWTVQAAPGGGFRAESNPVLPGSQSGIELTVPGNREVAFRTGWAKLRSNRIGGTFLNANGSWYAVHGQGGYLADEMDSVWHLPPGADHTLAWTSASANGAIDAMFLDQLSIDTPAFPIGESLGLPQKTFLSTGGGRWYGQDGITHGEGSAVSSPGSGSLITMFTGPGTVSWWWKSEDTPTNANARLIVWPHGQPGIYATATGSFDWRREEVILPWGQSFRLEWRATDTGTGRLLIDDVSFRESASDAYTVWAIEELLGGKQATMDADPDGDGQSNLMEFAFGSDPRSRRSAYVQDLHIIDGQIHLCLTHPDHDTTGLNYDLEFSSDLETWTRVRRIPGGPSLPDQVITCHIPEEAEGDRGFVRLRVGFANE
ncbi:hypothetical protein ACFQY0_11190 [Haloferula chungangensis]|uniref:Uncharacterized protein n=1 Tax=Haloferula chungangensis TaxID=1048331 RepID=A0ABW2L902_9BACT